VSGFSNTTNFTISGAAGNVTNGSMDTLFLPDSTDWVISGSCGNVSAGIQDTEEAVTAITVIVNNGAPTCAFSGLTSGSTYSSTQNWSITGYNATTAFIRFGTNYYLSMTEAGGTVNRASGTEIWSYDPTSLPWDEGTYTISAYTTDGTDTTTCTALTNVEIDDQATKIDILYLNAVANNGASSASTLQATYTFGNVEIKQQTLLYLAIAGVLVWFFFFKKK